MLAATALLLGSVSVTAAQAAPVGVSNRANAVRSAHSYLAISAFSFKGLVGQLKFEGYSTSDATYGASHVGANWMKQARRSAKAYLKMSPFSYTGLVEQLKFEGYTTAQARYGALIAR